jgi:diguanylate cyclase (GGDEF)-like protein
VRGRKRALAWSAVALVVGVTATLVAAARVRHDAERVAEEQFTDASEQAARTIEREVDGYLDELGDIGAFRAASPDASPEQFGRFVRGTGIFERLPSLAGIIFLEQVPPDELGATLERLRARDPDFALVPLGARPEGRPWLLLTYYVPGSIDLELPLGADISPITSISDVLASAEQSGSAVVGSFQDDPLLHQIAQATDFAALDQLINVDFFLGVPVYEEEPDAVDPATDAPLGWLSAPVAHFDSVLDAATSGLPANLGVSLTVDLSGVVGEGESRISRVAERAGDAGPRADATFDARREFEAHGVSWRLGVWSDGRPERTAERVALFSGLAMTVLAVLLVYVREQSLSHDRAFAAATAEREAFRRAVLDSVVEPMVVLDGNGRILAANPAWWQLRGVEAEGDEGPDVGLSYVGVLRATARGRLDVLIEGFERLGSAAEEEQGEVPPHRVDAVEVDLPIETSRGRRWYAVRVTPLRGRRGGSVVVHNDVTERKRAEAELALRASHDDLTGLLNRLAMEEEIDHAMQQARVQESAVAALFIDLDGFKPINDTYGHAVGDDVLRAVAQRITGAVRSSDRVARLGGDEFVVLIGPLSEHGDAEHTARRILDALHNPVDLGDLVVPIAASVGVAVVDAPLDASAQSLLDLADRAMYAAKQAGGGRYSLG